MEGLSSVLFRSTNLIPVQSVSVARGIGATSSWNLYWHLVIFQLLPPLLTPLYWEVLTRYDLISLIENIFCSQRTLYGSLDYPSTV